MLLPELCGGHFATVSYDGSIWMWNSKTLEHWLLTDDIEDQEGESIGVTSYLHTLGMLKQSFEEFITKPYLKEDTSKQSNSEVDTKNKSKETTTDTFFAKCIAFNPEGTKLASAYDYFKIIRFWDTKSGQYTDFITEHKDTINSIDFSPDGIWLVTASNDKTVRVFHSHNESLNEVKVITGSGQFNSASFSLDGHHIVTTSSDNTIRIWDADSFEEHRIFKGFDMFKSAIFSPDGKRIAAISQDNTIHIWEKDMLTPKIIENIITPDVNEVTFNSKGDQLIIHYFTRKTKVLDLTSKCIIDNNEYDLFDGDHAIIPNKELSSSSSISHDTIINDNESTKLRKKEQIELYAICSDAKYAAKVLHDNSIIIIDTTTNCMIDSLEGHTGAVFSISFSPDGKRLVSASEDGTIRIWPFPPLQDLIDQTRERFKDRPLTPEERRMYYLE